MGSDAETELLARCRRGDSDAWNELFDTHYSAAGRFVFQLGPGLALGDVQEICQETFLSVIRNVNSFRGGSRFQTWLFRIAANKTRDFIERQKAAKRGGGQVPVSLQAEDLESGLTLDPSSTLPGPDDIAMNQEQMRLVRQALDRLGEPCREILELRYFGDLSYDEIALTLKLNPKTVSSRLSKCLDRFEALARALFSRENSTPFSV